MPLVLDGTNGVSGVDGTASNPSLEGTDSNTGIFYPAADTVAIGTGGTERTRVSSDGTFRVKGAGTAGSTDAVQFNGSAPASSMTLDASGRLGIGATSTPASYQNILGYFQNGRSGWAYVVDDSANTHIVHNIIFNGTNNTYAGNGYASRMSIVDADGSFRWYQAASGSSGGVATLNERMRIDSSGNVGIGTTTTTSRLNVSSATDQQVLISASSSYNPYIRITNTVGDAGIGSLTGGETFIGALTNHACTFRTNNTERARINNAGYSKFSDNGTYLGAGNTFHEFRQSINDVNLIVHSSSTSLTDNVMYVRASRNTTNNTFYAFGYYNDAASAYKMRVAESGTITNTTGTYTTISDIKLKQDIVDASSQWDDIKALRIVKYRLKEYVQNDPDSKPFLGLIAQEVEQVCPSLVEEQEDEVMDEDGKLVKNGEVTKGVKTSILYMKAVKALQEAMTRIEQLEAKVAALENA